MLAGEKRLALSAGVVTGAVLIGIYATTLHGAPLPASATAVPEAFAGLALAYAIIVAAGTWGAVRPQRRREADTTGTWQFAAEMFGDLVVEMNAAGSVVGVTTSRATSLGMTARDLTGRGLFEHIHVADRPAFLKAIADAANSDVMTVATVRLRSSSSLAAVPAPPTYTWVAVHARLMAPGQVVAVLRDVDAAHDATIAAVPSAAEQRVTSDHFLADMSHELRTPLNANHRLLGNAREPYAPSCRRRQAARIRAHHPPVRSASAVGRQRDPRHVEDPLGNAGHPPEPFDIVPLTDLCCDMVALKAEEGRVRLVRDYAARPQQIVGDKRACKQILINLLSNAVKFTPVDGQVTIVVGIEGSTLVMNVSDTGIGIGADDLGRLGDPFFQARSATSRPFEGTGLGLSVVRGLVGLQGGTISIESDLGQGTRIKVRLPVEAKAARAKIASAAIETMVGRKAAAPKTIEPNASQSNTRQPVRSHDEQRMKSIA